ncbi:MAG: hypothetical protein Q9212_001476 [Teloschistes hypoglaucus]
MEKSSQSKKRGQEGSAAKRRELSAARPLEVPVVSYEEAAAACKAEVDRVIRDCQRRNQRHSDVAFDLEHDLMQWCRDNDYHEDCLVPLGSNKGILPRPQSVKRVEQIFENPQFLVEGLDAKDVRQAGIGDCWFMAAVCALGSRQDLLHKIYVARDEKIGVYGFVFHRDGEWIHEVIDDKLYLAHEDYNMSYNWARYPWSRFDGQMLCTSRSAGTQMPLGSLFYRKLMPKLTGTMVQFAVVEMGIEDLTGGVTTEIIPTDILDRDWFWTHELMNVGKLYLFGLAQSLGKKSEEKGIYKNHSYTILEARELDDTRLLKVRNPWGREEWTGPWGDGSEEWTPERLERLGHTFGNDGIFWISYNDLLQKFNHIDRTRLFGPDWASSQRWTSVDVPWSVQYLSTKFRISIPKACSVVVLDHRYFRGLDGIYEYRLQFKLLKVGHDGLIVESKPYYYLRLSVSTELDLEAGQYTVLVKIVAVRYESKQTPAQVITDNCEARAEKLIATAHRYEYAHCKCGEFQRRINEKGRLRETRRARRKQKAKEEYNKKRMVDKREKLIRLRKEARAKSKGKTTPTVSKDRDEIKISIKRDGSSLQHTEHFDSGSTTGATISHEGNGVNYKVSLEQRNMPGEASGGDKSGNDKQVSTAGGENEKSDTTSKDELSPSTIVGESAIFGNYPNRTLDDISDDELSWASDVNAPLDSSSSDSSHPDSDDNNVGNEVLKSNENESDETKSDDPWNAVCTIGLKIFTQGPRAEIEVVNGREEEVQNGASGEDGWERV